MPDTHALHEPAPHTTDTLSVREAFAAFVAASRPVALLPAQTTLLQRTSDTASITAFVGIDDTPHATAARLFADPTSAHARVWQATGQQALDATWHRVVDALKARAPILGVHGLRINELLGPAADPGDPASKPISWHLSLWNTFATTRSTPGEMGEVLDTLATGLAGIHPGYACYLASGTGRHQRTQVRAGSAEDAARIWTTVVGLDHPHPTIFDLRRFD